jgi:hypothetical protein
MFADGTIDGEQLAEMSKGIRAKLETIQQRLVAVDEAAAQRQEMSLDDGTDWNDEASREKWYGLHVERKRAYIRSRYDIVLHRHVRGSARVFDPATVQMSPKDLNLPEQGATPEGVARWKRERLEVFPAPR